MVIARLSFFIYFSSLSSNATAAKALIATKNVSPVIALTTGKKKRRALAPFHKVTTDRAIKRTLLPGHQ